MTHIIDPFVTIKMGHEIQLFFLPVSHTGVIHCKFSFRDKYKSILFRFWSILNMHFIIDQIQMKLSRGVCYFDKLYRLQRTVLIALETDRISFLLLFMKAIFDLHVCS